MNRNDQRHRRACADRAIHTPACCAPGQTVAWSAVALAAVAALAGCHQVSTSEPKAPESFYLNATKDLTDIGRVALVELENDSSYPNISKDMTEALYLAVQKKQIFGLTLVDRDAPSWQSLQSSIIRSYPLQHLLAMRQTLGCDAVLTGTVTQYQPYPHMAIGVRLKLIDLTDGQLVWGMEQVWDSSDRTTRRRIQSYYSSEMRSPFTSLREELVTISSLNFVRFVAYEVAQTFEP